jgi:polyhydroxyalkanoate synthase
MKSAPAGDAIGSAAGHLRWFRANEEGQMTTDFTPPALGEAERKDVADPDRPAIVSTPSVPTAYGTSTKPSENSKIDPLEATAEMIDHSFRGIIAVALNGVSPLPIGAAFADWAVHLAFSPGRQMLLVGKAFRKWTRLASIAADPFMRTGESPCIVPLPQDRRFESDDWAHWPFRGISQAFLLQQQWWHNATTGIHGVTKQHEFIVSFAVRQMLDMVSPTNFIATNPVVLRRIRETRGLNLVEGFANLVGDVINRRIVPKLETDGLFEPGKSVAVTKGTVVFRNRLIELIEYTPTTSMVKTEPVLIVPAWIMKYYILDLSPSNSLVRYLVDRGFTVFMISWHNPTEADYDLDLDDYRQLGVMAAIEAIGNRLPGRKIHATGYCLGGTLLSIAAASMARDGDDRLQTLSLLATEIDFSEPGELSLFINESQIAILEELMRRRGYLDGEQMANAFQILRSNDLVWSRIVHHYLMGEREPSTDLMAWNADTTRMPYRMQSQYLRDLFLDNDLAEGRFETNGQPVAITDIRVPIFAVGTERDHVVPWRSAFKIHMLADTDVTFVLTSGGHNAGIVSEPGHHGRGYRMHTKLAQDQYVDPDRWLVAAPKHQGSWWPELADWLTRHSLAEADAPKLNIAAPLGDAPGTYVFDH